MKHKNKNVYCHIYCVVKNCGSHRTYSYTQGYTRGSQSHKHNKASGITFHAVPKDPVRREKWVKIIRLLRRQKDWLPTKSTVICSKHFRSQDKFGPTIRGNILLSKEAVPILVNEEDDTYVVVVKEEVNDEDGVEKTECEEVEEPQYLAYDHEQPFFLHVPEEVKTEYDEDIPHEEIHNEEVVHDEDIHATEDDSSQDMFEWRADEEYLHADTDDATEDTDNVAEDLNIVEDKEEVVKDTLVKSKKNPERWICGDAPDEIRLMEMMQEPPPPLPDPLPYCFDDQLNGFRCKHCSFSNTLEGACIRHYRQKHGPHYIYCFACGYTFAYQSHLYRHEMKTRCRAPGIRIVRRLRKELLKSQEWRKRRELKLTGSRPVCSHCGADFSTAKELKEHDSLAHATLRRFQCHHCSAAYSLKSRLYSHLHRIHSSESKICVHCGESFLTRKALNQHLHIHGDKNIQYNCSHCPMKFKQKRTLVRHEASHTGAPPPYTCKFCNSGFWRSDNFKDHMERRHGHSIITKKKLARMLARMTSEQIEASLQVQGTMATFDSTPRQ